MKVKINSTNFENQVNKVYDNINELDLLIKELSQSIEEMSHNWVGSDFDNFKEKIYTFLGELLSTKDSIISYNDFLMNYVTNIKDLDERFNQDIRLT